MKLLNLTKSELRDLALPRPGYTRQSIRLLQPPDTPLPPEVPDEFEWPQPAETLPAESLPAEPETDDELAEEDWSEDWELTDPDMRECEILNDFDWEPDEAAEPELGDFWIDEEDEWN
ncbi:MAG: hypothetical protein SGJ20_19575 [Planctomycetota bacterium]|nr:hypothetical protein [Planctomycetota bacterium]